MGGTLNLRTIGPVDIPSVTDMVFEEIYRQVVELDLPPGTKLSEADVARQMDVSRQPVRDAFYRLSKLGFLVIRPQRATTIAPISVEAVRQARFIRTAIEMETISLAAQRIDDGGRKALTGLIEKQRRAIEADDKKRFHQLDDEFHRVICEIAGAGFAWSLIRENKAHMDRVRYLSLNVGARTALEDHERILAAMDAGDGALAQVTMRSHLGRILGVVEQLRQQSGELLEDVTP